MTLINDSSDAVLNRINQTKTRLQNLDDITLEQLQNVYKYRLIQVNLRSTGWLNVFLSGLTLYLGINTSRYSSSPIYDLQALFGAFALFVSLWAVIRPSLAGVRAFAIVFLVAAIWNLYLCIRSTAEGYSLPILTALLGFAQLWWAYQYNGLYRKNRFLVKPTESLLREYDQILKALHQTNSQTDADIVEFKFYQNRWRGWLLGNTAIFGIKKRRLFLLTREDKFVLRPHLAQLGTKKRLNIRVRIDDFSTRGVISRSYFDRYRQWKLQNNTGQAVEALELVGTGKNSWIPFGYLHPLVRIPVLIAGVIVILMVLFTILTFMMYIGYS